MKIEDRRDRHPEWVPFINAQCGELLESESGILSIKVYSASDDRYRIMRVEDGRVSAVGTQVLFRPVPNARIVIGGDDA